jgi:hypothetical protein
MESQNVRRLLLGINITAFGVILAVAGGGTVAIAVGVLGLAVSALTMLEPQQASA